MQQRLGERLRERERIARELHDTLLQGLQGLMLSFKSAAAHFPANHAGREAMDRALVRAEETLTEGRARVQDLRATDVPHELSELLALAALKLGADAALKVRMVTEGRPRELHPLVSQELVRIGEEAVFNAIRHAEARSFEIGVAYGSDRLTVRFSDDGRGIEPQVVRDGGRTGHYGLRGMRERALRIQGDFSLTSASGAGAEIQVVVPAKVAYVCAMKLGSPALRRAAGSV
jgi:signal transduction histidine kinase